MTFCGSLQWTPFSFARRQFSSGPAPAIFDLLSISTLDGLIRSWIAIQGSAWSFGSFLQPFKVGEDDERHQPAEGIDWCIFVIILRFRGGDYNTHKFDSWSTCNSPFPHDSCVMSGFPQGSEGQQEILLTFALRVRCPPLGTVTSAGQWREWCRINCGAEVIIKERLALSIKKKFPWPRVTGDPRRRPRN